MSEKNRIKRIERYEAEVDIEKYIKDYVNVEEFLTYCEECPNYDKVWSCPPYDFDQLAYWNKFKTILIIGRKIYLAEGTTQNEARLHLREIKHEMAEELYVLEEKYPGSKSLSAGSCNLCGDVACTRQAGIPCRNADKMRYSIESIGGNVGKTIHDYLGIDIEWIEDGKLPEYFVLIGGLLRK